MMRGVVLMAAGTGLAWSAGAQDLAETHRLIGERYHAEQYGEVIRLVDRQVQQAAGTGWADSTYLYVYWYGRAKRMVDGPDAGAAGARHMVELVRERGNPGDLLKALFDLSWTYYELGRIKDCLHTDSLAMIVADGSPDITPVQRGRARQYLAFDHSMLGDHRGTARYARAALEQYARADSVPSAQWAESYNALGVALWRLGRVREAEINYRKALEAIGTDSSVVLLLRRASTQGNLGVIWQNAGDLARGKAYYHESLRDFGRALEATHDPAERDEVLVGRSRNYLNLAAVYFAMGDMGRARELLGLAWDDRSKVLGANDIQLLALNERMAEVELAQGNTDKAQALVESYLTAWVQAFGKKGDGYAQACAKLADIAFRKGDRGRADSLYRCSMETARQEMGQEANAMLLQAYRGRAEMRASAGRHAEAMEDLGHARAIAMNIAGERNYKVAQVDVLMAEQAFKAGLYVGAHRHALAAMEELGDRIKVVEASQMPVAFPDPHVLPDAIYWKVRTEQAMEPQARGSGKWDKDLDLAIRALSRSRIAVDDQASKLQMTGAQQQLFDLALDEAYDCYMRTPSEQAMQRFFNLAEADRTVLLKGRLGGFTALNFAGVPDSLLTREAELQTAMQVDRDDPEANMALDVREQEYRALLQYLEKNHPKYFNLKYGDRIPTLREVRERLLTPERQLLLYARTKQALYVMVVGLQGTHVAKLDPQGLAGNVKALNEAINQRRTAAYVEQAYQLYQRIVAPVENLLTAHELLIIPDKELHTVNFEALLSGPEVEQFPQRLMIQRHAMAYLLSATASLQFADLAKARAKGVLAMAPGFDDRMKQQYLQGLQDSSTMDRAFLHYVRQPFAVRTAQRMGKRLAAQVFTGAEASEGNFRKMIGNSGLLYLGTHAEMDPERPMYSRIVLGKEGDGRDAERDGYLHAYELYELDIRAQLAVLTACESGGGREDAGEGVRSLGTSFAYAGCPSLVVALWNIDEKVSADIIDDFHDGLAAGLPKHEALRQAKLHYLAQARDELLHPYYWAGLVLLGDVGPVELEKRRATAWAMALLGLAAAAGMGIWGVGRRKRRGQATPSGAEGRQ
ncbi:MAG TPA: CHAT domain-containing protein [Flavobacteriales bacterium]|nr:CHAT domain-containing protein [Flavobacteriales bacterium]